MRTEAGVTFVALGPCNAMIVIVLGNIGLISILV